MPQSGDWQTFKKKNTLKKKKKGHGKDFHIQIGRFRLSGGVAKAHLADAAALPFGGALLVVLLELLREEGVENQVDQLRGGGFGGTLAVLLDLGGVTDGLPSGSSPGWRKKKKSHLRSRIWYLGPERAAGGYVMQCQDEAVGQLSKPQVSNSGPRGSLCLHAVDSPPPPPTHLIQMISSAASSAGARSRSRSFESGLLEEGKTSKKMQGSGPWPTGVRNL